jgi:SAM-dependent methyltransferase
MASAGAEQVVGLDIKPRLVGFSNAYLRRHYAHLTHVVEFRAVHLRDYDESVAFDLIVSKDTFEHIIDLDGMLWEMKKRLKPGGRIYAGFGPLYPSPYGDHDRRRTALAPWGFWGRLLAAIPWGHLGTESLIVRMNNRHRKKKATSMHDLGLNKMSATDFWTAFDESGLAIIDFRVNRSRKTVSRIFSLMAKVPILKDYVTHNVYCILEKAGG